MAVPLSDAYRMRDADEMLYSVVVFSSVSTTAAAAAAAAADDDDASQCDVIAPHPEHLLLVNLGQSSRTKSVLSTLLLLLL